jgi:hypothetical protein
MNLDDLYRLLRSGHVQSQGIVDTLHDPLLVLGPGLIVVNANLAFFETFQVERDAVLGHPLPAPGNGQWNIPALLTLHRRIIEAMTQMLSAEQP